jgi:hypothetical protein
MRSRLTWSRHLARLDVSTRQMLVARSRRSLKTAKASIASITGPPRLGAPSGAPEF